VLEATIPLPDTGGRIDHMAVDLKRGRLFVAELGNGTVDVVDLASRKVMHRLGGLKEPQGVGYSQSADVKLTRFGGALQAFDWRLHDAQDTPALPA
jgi:hypothetical protein